MKLVALVGSWAPALIAVTAALLVLPLATRANAPPGGPGGEGTKGGEAPLPGDGSDARRAREALVAHLAAGSPTPAPRVLAALREVPRHLFMPGASLPDAYADRAFPIGHRQTISQPTVVAIMSDALDLDGSERVLEIGTGSGYQAAVLARLARRVYSIEIVEPLGVEARDRLARLGYDNVEVRIGDGYRGWPEEAPFDRILLTAAPPSLPEALVAQLREGGILVGPVGSGDEQWLGRWVKRDGRIESANLGGVRFVPMVAATPEP